MSNIKFFKNNILNSTTSVVFTTAVTASATYLFDENDGTKLSSVASSDTVSEVWDFEFTGAQPISGFHIANHNVKAFSVKYWSTTSYVDFSTPIATTTNSGTYTFLGDFDNVSSSKVRFSFDTTIDANDQKSVGGIRILKEIGEMSRNPIKANTNYHENSKSYYTDSKENVFVLFGVSTKFDLSFNNAPAIDISILEDCKYLGEPFYVYLCGGSERSTARGWRLQDIALVNYTNSFDPKTTDNALQNGEDIKVKLEGVKTRST